MSESGYAYAATPEHEGEQHDPTMNQLHHVMAGTSYLDRLLGVAEGVLSSPLGHGAHHALGHGAPSLMPFLGSLVGPLGFVAGAGEAVLGAREAMNGSGMKQADGIVDVLKGGAGMVSGAGSFLSAAGAFPAVGAAGTGFAGSGLTAGAAAGPLAAAGAVGLGTGTLIAHHMDGNLVDGFFGKDDAGRPRDAFDWGADQGIGAERWIQSSLGIKEGGDGFLNSIGDKAAGVLGGGVAGLMGTGAVLAGLGAEAVHGAGHALSGVEEGIVGGLFSNYAL